jgi:hypothetical protein
MPRLPRALIAVSVLLFAVAVLLPAAYYIDGPRSGLDMLVVGWIGPILHHFGWYANPLLLTSWILGLSRKPRRAEIRVRLGYVALAVACTSFVSLPLCDMPRKDGMVSADFMGLGPAIFVWLAAFVLDMVSARKGLEALRAETMTLPPRAGASAAGRTPGDRT